MIQLNTQFSDSTGVSARYYIAQHMPDLMRKELRNIGVLVQKGEFRAAKFLGEREPAGEIDGRALRYVSDPQLYRMWVRHWRAELNKADWESRLFGENRKTFAFVPGGEVTDTGADTADDIAAYLYSLLVSTGGLSEALSVEREDEAAEIRRDLKAELRNRQLMASSAGPGVRHPVYEPREVKGDFAWHLVAFYQEIETEKRAWAFEPLNLATNQRQHVRERAGYLAYVFGDIRRYAKKHRREVNTLAIVSVTDEYREEAHVKYAINVIRNHADIVDWSVSSQRNQFLNEREAVAHAA